MAKQTYNLAYDGYWLDRNKSGVPATSGIYTVYRATYDPSTDKVILHEVIYIGESSNVRDRIAGHEKIGEWKRHLRRGEELCFSFAPVPAASRLRTEAALIHHHKPSVNAEYVDVFPFDETIVTTSGTSELLSGRFTVHRKEARVQRVW